MLSRRHKSKKKPQRAHRAADTRYMTQNTFIKSIPQRLSLTLTPLPLLCLLMAGCTFDAPNSADESATSSADSSSGGSSSDEASTSGATANEGPIVEPFDQLLVQTVQWFDKDVTIEKAETRTATQTSWLGDSILEREHIITVRVQNRTRFPSNIAYEHWDLFLADGTRLKGETDRADFGPQDALFFQFLFEDNLGRSLEGAYLELNGDSYGEYKPLILPLDVPVEKEPVFVLSEFEGYVFEGDLGEGNAWRHEIVSARVSLNSTSDGSSSVDGSRAEVGKKLVDLVVRTTAMEDTANLFDSSYHLLVNGVGVSPDNNVNEVPKVGEPIEVPVVFQIDENATEFDVEFDVEQGSGDTWSTFHVDLQNATPVEY